MAMVTAGMVKAIERMLGKWFNTREGLFQQEKSASVRQESGE